MPNVIKWYQREAFDAGSQATLFNDYFKFVLDQPVTVSVNSVVNSDRANLVTELGGIQVSREWVLKPLKDLETTKAIGPDNMSPIVLKECSNELAESFCMLMNKSFRKVFFLIN